MNLIKEKASIIFSDKGYHSGRNHEILTGLCSNCDHRKTCTWKENKKIYCEHFE